MPGNLCREAIVWCDQWLIAQLPLRFADHSSGVALVTGSCRHPLDGRCVAAMSGNDVDRVEERELVAASDVVRLADTTRLPGRTVPVMQSTRRCSPRLLTIAEDTIGLPSSIASVKTVVGHVGSLTRAVDREVADDHHRQIVVVM